MVLCGDVDICYPECRLLSNFSVRADIIHNLSISAYQAYIAQVELDHSCTATIYSFFWRSTTIFIACKFTHYCFYVHEDNQVFPQYISFPSAGYQLFQKSFTHFHFGEDLFHLCFIRSTNLVHGSWMIELMVSENTTVFVMHCSFSMST